jgi:DNA-binding SARP family transcriptional activator
MGTRVKAVLFGLLGPVEIRVPVRPPVALPPALSALLARLALNPGRVVSVDALTDALWGEDLPADAANALQVRVSKLRRALVEAGVTGDVLLTRAPGYLLAVEPDAIDVHRFEQLLTRARQLVADGNPRDALALMDEALALWRGPAVGGVGDAEWIEAESGAWRRCGSLLSKIGWSSCSSWAGTARRSPTSSGWRPCTRCASGCTGCS